MRVEAPATHVDEPRRRGQSSPLEQLNRNVGVRTIGQNVVAQYYPNFLKGVIGCFALPYAHEFC
jgi:hypothetical protein